MKFYDNTKTIYLETDASGVGLEAALLQLHEGTTCQKDIVPNNTILCPIALASKGFKVQNADAATLSERTRAYFMPLKNFIIIVLPGKSS